MVCFIPLLFPGFFSLSPCGSFPPNFHGVCPLRSAPFRGVSASWLLAKRRFAKNILAVKMAQKTAATCFPFLTRKFSSWFYWWPFLGGMNKNHQWSIYHLYIANWVIIYHLPPIGGNQKQPLKSGCGLENRLLSGHLWRSTRGKYVKKQPSLASRNLNSTEA